ncbi:putative geranylgeranyl pyrophosphate synthetase protein [Botrytis fragariae]|uniref:Putative geranylgeranyl pyrophosphate synthetase protein n=1 Tax=Botrytis fragariae TaxID=1964551 RepID=A0A8H6EJ49_9HELO|nr:putative geranylgeranyl pyrophosphate synthetase protein [Botrytis fragariae]KAF5874158.1 putative geranylgeranyl pyrophosphate synthetase protein [Botrytis fragariae]
MATNKITPSPKATVALINASGPPGRYTISFGSHHYVVELSKVPWLGAYIDLMPRDNASYTQPSDESEHESDQSVPYLFIAAQGIINGYYFCFKMLPPELSHYYKLCQTLDVISAENLSSSPKSLQELLRSIDLYRNPKTPQDVRMRHRARAGTAAFKFVYLMISGDFNLDSKVLKAKRKLALRFVKTVLSNQDDFIWEIRKVVRAAYQVRFEANWDVFKMLDHLVGANRDEARRF